MSEPLIEAYIELEVRDSTGRVVYRLEKPSESWVANFPRILQGLMKATGIWTHGIVASTSVRDATGAYVSAWTEWYTGSVDYGGGTPMACNAPNDDSSYGIVVGSGTNPVTYDDYKLANPIAHGTGPGQLDYEPHTITDVVVESGYAYFKISRSFRNLSGSDVRVAEVGIIARSYWKDGGGVRQDVKYLIARDVLREPITVPPYGVLTVTYTIKGSL